MPRRPQDPSDPADPVGEGEGFPGDGDPYEGDPTPAHTPSPAPAPTPDPMLEVRSRMDRLERENADLRRLIPPATPKPPAVVGDDPFDAVDWDKELFASPKDAIRKAMDLTEKKVEARLRGEYNRDKGTQDFWNKFYSLHPDLRDDHDLVEVTLNSNLSALANIRVEDAYEKLAELTRERILRYAGGAARSRSKARVEGGSGTPATPRPKPDKAPDDGVTSLTDLLRTRRQKRRAGAA